LSKRGITILKYKVGQEIRFEGRKAFGEVEQIGKILQLDAIMMGYYVQLKTPFGKCNYGMVPCDAVLGLAE
jgi:hypothetical protein